MLEQVWFAGVHCDVGGGYADCGLADRTLLWMADRVRACGLAFQPGHLCAAAGIPPAEASSAMRRMHELGAYRAAGLARWEDAGGPVIGGGRSRGAGGAARGPPRADRAGSPAALTHLQPKRLPRSRGSRVGAGQ